MVNISLLLTVLTLLGHSVADEPTWPTSCSMSLYPGKEPRASYYSTSHRDTESLCREKCEGDSSCGMYQWIIRSGECWLHHTSVELVAQVMGLEEREVMARSSYTNMGSKKCEGVIYDHNHCPEYPKQYERKYISGIHSILNVFSISTTPSQCHHLCSTYPQCRSVRCQAYSSSIYCYLYSTTITELLESGKADEVKTDRRNVPYRSTTYERYCGDVPYDPSTTETTTTKETTTPTDTTTPPLDCSDLSDIDGATLCLPIGHGDEATCQAIPGCCYLEVGGLVPFTMCVRTFGCGNH